VVLLVLMLTGIPGAIANETTPVSFEEGATAKENTEVVMDKGTVSFTDKSAGLSATTTTTIDGVAFIPAKTTESKDLEWSTGELDPIVKMVYSYDGKTLKETITIKEDKTLTFPITLSTYSKLIPWDHGQWKIVRSNSFETMKGIVLEKPYGIDAAGKRIEMEYTYKDGVLALVYDRTITEWVEEEKIVIDNKTSEETTEIVWVPKYSAITYPLVIDPTWVAIDGHWIDNTTNATHTVEMWNATGTTTWTPPAGVTSVEYLVVGAGGGGGSAAVAIGGGGGAGEVQMGTLTALSGSAKTVTVGAGGVGAANAAPSTAYPSVFDSITALKGGRGGGYSATATPRNGENGGSGGGGSCQVGGAGDPGFGGNGTDGTNTGASYLHGHNGGNGGSEPTGGGGGVSAVGSAPSGATGGNGGAGISAATSGNLAETDLGGGGGGSGVSTGGTATHGGGNGGSQSANPGNGKAGTGGGGGGTERKSPYTGGNGGSGIVIIKYLKVAPTAPIASFVITLADTSTGLPSSWQWNVTNLLGNNTEVTFSTSQHTNMTLGQGNWLVKLTATNSLGSSSATKYIGLNLSSSLVYFWNRTG